MGFHGVNIFLVAASNAHPRSRAAADFFCDGVDDQVEIQAALNTLPTSGGIVMLTEGTFNLTDSITVSRDYVALLGEGRSTYLSATIAVPMIVVDKASVILSQIEIGNFRMRNYGNGDGLNIGATATAIHGVHAHDIGFTGNGYTAQSFIVVTRCTGGMFHNLDFGNVGVGLTVGTLLRCTFRTIRGAGIFDSVLDPSATLLDTLFEDIVADCEYTGNGFHIRDEGRNLRFANCAVYRAANWSYLVYVLSGGTVDMHDVTFVNCHSVDAGQTGGAPGFSVYTDQSSRKIVRLQFIGCTSQGSQGQGFYLCDCEDVLMLGCVARNNGKNSGLTAPQRAGVYIGATSGMNSSPKNIQVKNCYIYDDQATATQQWGIYEGSGADNNLFEGNHLRGNGTGQLYKTGSATKARRNTGYITENSGTDTITQGNTYVTVSHGLSVTPAAKDIIVTPTNSMGNATKFWVDNIGASTFRINVDADPGAGGATFAWQAVVL